MFLLFHLKPMIYSYHGSEKGEKYDSTNMAQYIHTEVSITMHSIIQMKQPLLYSTMQ